MQAARKATEESDGVRYSRKSEFREETATSQAVDRLAQEVTPAAPPGGGGVRAAAGAGAAERAQGGHAGNAASGPLQGNCDLEHACVPGRVPPRHGTRRDTGACMRVRSDAW
mmetsp:Transcript_35153/g.109747  ORF Transcript_35153/g.109747 Transcript_35153/m.109747 type:complete len:112 (+) Transcript_35153:64-399(+)